MARTLACGLACFLILCFSNCAVSAAEYDVNWDATGDFTTIQEAIDVANDGDAIIVHPGTYYENIHFDGKNITLQSLDPDKKEIVASTIIDGGQRDSVVTFVGTENDTCLLSGFTITNGKAKYGGGINGGRFQWGPFSQAAISNCTITGNSAGAGGGVCSCEGTISNCTISDNSSDHEGGGLYDCYGPINNCTISGNSAAEGGGLYDRGGLYSRHPMIGDCTFSGNSAVYEGGGLNGCFGTISNCTITGNSAGYGGGLNCCRGTISNCTITGNSARAVGGGLENCDATISNCTITENSAVIDGGGLGGCYATISTCTITGNSAGDWGGGVCSCHRSISNCRITGNTASQGGGLINCNGPIGNCTISSNLAEEHGGGLAWCDGTISTCTISGNSAGEGGGLIWCDGTINNCTISGNGAAGYGGGLRSCGAMISNCIVWGNEAGQEGKQLYDCEAAVITYCCVQGWTGGGQGNISDDPLFVSGPLGDYYLSCRAAGQAVDSPCIDRGSATAGSFGLNKFTTRTDHMPDTGIVDMGYHYPLALPENPYVVCSLNGSEFAPGDVLVGFMEAQNPGLDVAVDAYIAFVLPNGAIVSLRAGGLVIGIYPWVSNVVLPSGFHIGPSEVLWITVPRSPGSYLFAAALTRPGRFEFIGESCLFPFVISQ